MIRAFRPDDLSRLTAIADRAWAPIYAERRRRLGDAAFAALHADPATAKGLQVRAACAQHPERMLVCERGGTVVGFCTLLLDPQGPGEIGNNAIDPLCGEKGVGQELYREAIAWFARQGCRMVKVTTGLDEAHTPARRSYERAGFALTTTSITYYLPLT